MRQIKRYPNDKEYDFGIGITNQFGLRKEAGDFVTEEEVKKYQIPEKYLEPKGTEKKDWSDEIPDNTNIIMFNIETEISGGDEFERKRMIDQFEREFQDHVQQKGTVILKVSGIKIVKKRKR